jgi:DNA-binding transcriptional LysR family regulator
MNASSQCQLGSSELATVLAVQRAGTLADAAERLGVDTSTVFRNLKRLERSLGQSLFEASRKGYRPTDLALALAEHAEQIERSLESARSAAQSRPGQVSGMVRITTTDTILHSLVAPVLRDLRKRHPLLNYELHTGNELASLTRRDADIALRATKRPPPHLVGKHIGAIGVALYAAKRLGLKSLEDAVAKRVPWIAPDEAIPEHPSVLWRKRRFPKLVPTYRVSSILTVMELVVQRLGVGLLPAFLAGSRIDLSQLTDVIDECQTELWLLTHAESRHLLRVSTVFGHLARTLSISL